MKRSVRVLALVGAALLVLASCRVETESMIQSHRSGEFIAPAATFEVDGVLDPTWPGGGTLTVDGVPTAFADATVDPDRSWTATLPLTPGELVREVVVVYTADGITYRQMLRVLVGDTIADDLDSFSPDGVGMRFTNAGLAGLGPVIQDLSAGSFDLDALLVGQEVETDIADATIYEAGAGNIGLVPTVTPHGVRTQVTLHDLYLGINLSNVTIVGSCRLDVTIPSVTIDGYYDLASYGDGTGSVDVNLLGGTPGATNGQPDVSIPTVDSEFTSGSCDPDTPLLGAIVGAIAGDTGQMVRDAFGGQLADPDGAGPLDSPIADAVEGALEGIEIAGSVGGAVGAHLQAPLLDVAEDANGMTFRSDANFGIVDPVTGLETCAGHPDAPDLESTADLPSGAPSFGALTPSGQPYGLGLGISSSAFNQMLGTMVECGLLNSTISSFELAPGVPVPLTASILKALMPKFGDLHVPSQDRDALFEIRVRPTASPFLTGQPGPNGEPAELMIANLALDFIVVGNRLSDGTVVDAGPFQGSRPMTMMIDAPFGFDLSYDAGAGELQPILTPPTGEQVDARITYNPIQQPEATAEALFEQLFPDVSAGMAEGFSAFPLPEFLGLSIDVLEVAEVGNVWHLYANLNAAEVTRMENFAVTDLSTGDWEEDDSASSSSQWRHRLRKTWSSGSANIAYQSNLAADSIIFSDKQAAATSRYRLSFDVVPAPGATWKVDLAHNILGAYTCRSEGTGGGRCEMGFTSGGWSTASPIRGTVQVGGGAPQSFDFNPSPQKTSRSGGNFNTQFGGANALSLTGTTPQSVVVTFEWDQRAGSFCGGFLCGGDGHEASLRMGIGDTLSNNFTAGDYPGQGNRNAAQDGHFATVTVSEL